MDLRGVAVTFLDTAGIRRTDDLVESLGVNLAIERATMADIRIFLLDSDGMIDDVPRQEGDLIVLGKADMITGLRHSGVDYRVSGLTGAGVSDLLDVIGNALSAKTAGAAIITRERHRIAIESALHALIIARTEVDKLMPVVEIAAEELRTAARSLEVLVGRIDVEALLSEIFASFCIGK